MKKELVLFFIGLLIVCSCDGKHLRRNIRQKRADSDFILRSCTATAQLTRKHRRNDPSKPLSENTLPNFSSASLVLENSRYKTLANRDNYTVNKRLRNELRQRGRSKGRLLVTKTTTDTPLGTIDVQPLRRDVPKVFKKKVALPELDRTGAARNLNVDAPIITVYTLKPTIN